MYLSLHVKSLMGLKIWWSWSVEKLISNLHQVRVFLENHAQKSHFVAAEIAVFSIKFAWKWLQIESMGITEPAKANQVQHEKPCPTSQFAPENARFCRDLIKFAQNPENASDLAKQSKPSKQRYQSKSSK